MRWVPAVLGLLIALGSAEAGPGKRGGGKAAAAAKAKEHSDRGLEAYKAEDYDGAIAAWKDAYKIDPDPGTLFAIGQAQRLAGDCQAALETYQEVLQSYISAKQGREVRKVIEICEKKVGVAGAKKRKPEKAFKVEKPKQAEPAPEPEPEPEKSRPPVEEEAAAPADEPEETKPAREADDAPKEREGGTPWYRDTLGAVLVGAGVIGVATGATFVVLARGHESSARDAIGYDAFSEHASAASRDRKIGVVGLAVGGALVVGGVVRYITRPSGAKREGVEVTGWVTPGGGAIGVGGAF